MCKRWGKKKREEIFGKNPINLFRNEDGTRCLSRNGRPVEEGYMSRMLNAWSALNMRLHSEQSTCDTKLTRTNQRYLDKLDSLYMYGYMYGAVRMPDYSRKGRMRRRNHLARQNVTIVTDMVGMGKGLVRKTIGTGE